MKLAFLLLCAFLTPAWGQNAHGIPGLSPDNAQHVSITRLLANPKDFDNHHVQIIGFLHFEFEGDAIYPYKMDYQIGRQENSIWVDAGHLSKAEKDALTNHYVLLDGTFHADKHGHMGMFGGQLSDIDRLETWDVTEGLVPPPPPPPPSKK